MTDFVVSLFHGLFEFFLLAVAIFLAIGLSMKATNSGDTFKERVHFAFWGTGIIVTLLAYYSLFNDLFAEDKPPASSSASPARMDASLPAPSPKTDSSGTTAYIKNYRYKGDEPIAIRCEQRGARAECKAVNLTVSSKARASC